MNLNNFKNIKMNPINLLFLIILFGSIISASIIILCIEIIQQPVNPDKNNKCENNRILKCINKDNLYIQKDSINKYPVVECKCYLKD